MIKIFTAISAKKAEDKEEAVKKERGGLHWGPSLLHCNLLKDLSRQTYQTDGQTVINRRLVYIFFAVLKYKIFYDLFKRGKRFPRFFVI